MRRPPLISESGWLICNAHGSPGQHNKQVLTINRFSIILNTDAKGEHAGHTYLIITSDLNWLHALTKIWYEGYSFEVPIHH